MPERLLSLAAADGCPVSAHDEGHGAVAVVLAGGGLDDGRSYAGLAARLATRHRVLRLVRRQYRADVDSWRPVGLRDEAADVVAVAAAVGRPCYLFGHSSGGVAALEAALAAPDRFDALAVFEPPVSSADLPLGSPAAALAARRALDAGRPGKALQVFLRDVVRVPPALALLSRLVTLSRRYRDVLVPGQVADYEALLDLGDRLPAYAAVRHHVLLLTGERSPEHLLERSMLLERALPSSDAVRLPRARHGAPADKPAVVAELLLADIADRLGG